MQISYDRFYMNLWRWSCQSCKLSKLLKL